MRVSFNLDDGNLFHDIPAPPAMDNTSPLQTLRNKPTRAPFAISDLAPASSRRSLQPTRGMQPTFDPRPSNDDEMDWTPSISTSITSTTTNFNPRTPRTSASARAGSSGAAACAAPTPFRGTLPAAPLAPAAALLRQNPSTFRKASAYAQAAFADLSAVGAATGSTRRSAGKRRAGNVNGHDDDDDDSNTDDATHDDDDNEEADTNGDDRANGPIGRRTRSSSRTPGARVAPSVKGRAAAAAAAAASPSDISK